MRFINAFLNILLNALTVAFFAVMGVVVLWFVAGAVEIGVMAATEIRLPKLHSARHTWCPCGQCDSVTAAYDLFEGQYTTWYDCDY